MTPRTQPMPHPILVLAVALGGFAPAQVIGAQAPRATQRIEVHEASITDLQRAMTDGRTTSVQLVDAYLARIAAYETQGPALNAMIRLNPTARADAARRDAERRRGEVRGPLHGIPIIVKDNFDTEGLATTGGSIALAGNVPTADATVVRKLRDAGAVIIGKSNLHELAAGIISISSQGGQTRNPYDPRRNPGGSSGGTGAAIAASFAAVGWGSDTCGSIRIPCAFANLVGLRPTQGMVSGHGIIPLSHTQDIGGPLARTVTDLAIALDATVGPDSADPGTRVHEGRTLPRFTDALSATALRGARIGLLMNYMTDIDSEVADTIRAATRAMGTAGATVVEVNIPEFEALIANSSVIPHEFKFDLMDYLATHPGAGVRSLREILDRGLYHDALRNTFEMRDATPARTTPAYEAALAKRPAIRDRMVAVMDSLRLDALVYPTVRRKPAFIGEAQVGGNCALAAQSGLPALSAPAGFGNDGLPIGIELLGRPWADARLVALAYAFEQLGSRRRPPPTTPALVDGRAPLARTFTTIARSGAAVARTTFTYRETRNELAYTVRIAGVAPSRIAAVVLLRAGAAGSMTSATDSAPAPVVRSRASHVVHRLSGPESATASGTIHLDGINLRALIEGRLEMSLVVAGDSVVERTRLRMPVRMTAGSTRAASAPRSGFITVKPDVRLHYLDWGGSGDAVLLLPGLYGSAEIFSDFARGLGDEFRVLALSRRGHGRSDEPATGYEPDTLVADIRAVLDSLRIDRVHLVGHSLAGVEVTAFAGRYPDRVGRLVYLDAAYDRQHQRRLPPNPIRAPSFTPDLSSPDAYIASMRNSPYWGPVWSAPVEAQLRAVLAPAPNGGMREKPGAETLARIRGGLYSAAPNYELIRAPVLGIYAMLDSLPAIPPATPPAVRDSAIARHRTHMLGYERASIDQLRGALPHARIIEMRNTHHHLFIQRRDEVVRIVRRFLGNEGDEAAEARSATGSH